MSSGGAVERYEYCGSVLNVIVLENYLESLLPGLEEAVEFGHVTTARAVAEELMANHADFGNDDNYYILDEWIDYRRELIVKSVDGAVMPDEFRKHYFEEPYERAHSEQRFNQGM